MQTVEILLLATLGLVLLGGLVSLGLGHRRWSIGTVVAGFLVLLAAATYLYLAARLGERDRLWARKIADYQVKLAKVRDDQEPEGGTAGELRPAEGGPESLDRLREKRDRWQRGLDRVDTWRGRVWQGASFLPPKDDASTGRVELAAEANAEDSPPIGPGAHVFLFDAIPVEEGGAYIGEFLVESTAFDQATKRHSLTVVQTAPRDDYDKKVLAKVHDSVTVFEQLPVDRWLVFYRSPPRLDDTIDPETALPRTAKEDADSVRGLLETGASGSPQVRKLVEQFVETFKQHEKDVPEDEWEAAAKEAAAAPGTLWATVTFTKPHSFRGEGEAPDAAAAERGPKQDFEPGEEADFDLETAWALGDVATIKRVFRRRPLTDALTLLHGSQAPTEEGVGVEGTATLLRLLQAEIAALEQSNERLAAARAAAAGNTGDEQRVAEQLTKDLRSWRRDVQAATDLVAGFERELDRVTRALRSAEAAIVNRGRELTAGMKQLAGQVDRVAPPPERRAATP